MDPRTGRAPIFHEVVGGQRYGGRLRSLIDAAVTQQYNTIGRSGHGDADHAAAGAVSNWSSIEQIADESKRVTDGVFGGYNSGPALRHATGHLQDR